MSKVSHGELVLLNDDDSNTKRGSWPLGQVVKTLPGRDGTVRIVVITIKDGIYTHPVAKLYRLENT